MNFRRSVNFETVDYTVSDGVALIRLNREQRHNAINAQMSIELPSVWQLFNNDSRAFVAIVTGAGEKAFCTGADLADLPELDLTTAETATASMGWTALQNKVWKPVICAVNGMAVGGGLHFIADSDIVLAADNATFFDNHVNVGLVSGLEPVALARRVPMEAVLRMALVGGKDRMNAMRALQCGLVGEVVPKESLLERAYELAGYVAENSPEAMANSKRSIWGAKEKSLNDALLFAWEKIIDHNKTPDFEEGSRAYLEKRKPFWQPYLPD